MVDYNRTRFVDSLLENNKDQPPSFKIHLHAEHWNLNNGSKFLYNNQVASLLDDIREHRIPADFLGLFTESNVPFYEGCLIVELIDYRPIASTSTSTSPNQSTTAPLVTRVVLFPTPETVYTDICLLGARYGARWTDMDALEAEARILLATAPPLCLDPDPHLTRAVNATMKVSTPSTPTSLKRKASAALDAEDARARRAKVMQFMKPRETLRAGGG
ncbi:hypothetical protein K525DRAFT_213043 [Schizophyllum commune Loenen D]|nr:hypothetical protein K525DRAFT_213043 [Schizophyllum commune Loenen D]